MKEQLTQRLAQLREEFELGQTKLNQLNTETQQLQNTLLRISGAIQVLEEELDKEPLAETSTVAVHQNGLSTAT